MTVKPKWLAILRDPHTSTPWEHPELPGRTFRSRAASERAAERAPRALMEEYWAQQDRGAKAEGADPEPEAGS